MTAEENFLCQTYGQQKYEFVRSCCSSIAEECYKFVHDDAKLGRFFQEDAKLVLRKQELIEKRDRLSKANAAMANIQVSYCTVPYRILSYRTLV